MLSKLGLTCGLGVFSSMDQSETRGALCRKPGAQPANNNKATGKARVIHLEFDTRILCGRVVLTQEAILMVYDRSLAVARRFNREWTPMNANKFGLG
jgi:hypothetical protein